MITLKRGGNPMMSLHKWNQLQNGKSSRGQIYRDKYKIELVSPELVATFFECPKKLKCKKKIKRRINNNRERIKCAKKGKDNFVEISMTSLDCM